MTTTTTERDASLRSSELASGVCGISRAVPSQLCRPSSETPGLSRFCKFNLVGGIGIAVQFAALFLLKGLLHFHYAAATAIAVEAAVIHNFVWHEQFTRVDRIRVDRIWVDRMKTGRIPPSRRRSLQRFLRFNLTNGAVSILGNLALMKVMVGQGRMNYLIANAIAIALCSLANVVVSDEWVFEKEAR